MDTIDVDFNRRFTPTRRADLSELVEKTKLREKISVRSPISYLISSRDGFGHLSRAVPLTEALNEQAPDSIVELFVDEKCNNFLKKNLIVNNYRVHAFPYYGLSHVDLVKKNDRNLKKMQKSKVLVTDFVRGSRVLRDEVKRRKGLGEDTYLVGLYHANLVGEGKRVKKSVSSFMQRQRRAIEKMDLYLHTTMNPDPYNPTSTPVVPIPLIVRKQNQSKETVKRKHGLKAHQKFLYVAVGGKGLGSMSAEHRGKSNYEYLFEAVDQMNPKDFGVDKIIVNKGGLDYQFTNRHVESVDAVPNGQDYVAAAEAVVGKPGMGTLAECFKYGTPFVMAKWDLNSEEAEKVRMIKEVTAGRQPTIWERSLEHITDSITRTLQRKSELQDYLTRVPTNGDEVAARILKKLQNHTGPVGAAFEKDILAETPYTRDAQGRFQPKVKFDSREDYQLARRNGVVRLATEGLTDKSRVLEIGCNSGKISNFIAGKGYETYGVDLSARSVERANKNKHDKAHFEVMDAFNLKYKSNQFDSIVLTEILEHVDNPDGVLREAIRVAKPGGKVIVGVPRNYDIYSPGHRLFFTPESLQAVAEKYSSSVQFQNILGIDRHMHVVLNKSRKQAYSQSPTLYETTLQYLRNMKRAELENMAAELPMVSRNQNKFDLRKELMDYKVRTMAVEGRPIHRGTKVVHPAMMGPEDVAKIDQYKVLYGLASRKEIDLPYRERFNKAQLKVALLTHFQK
jgi:2-polyprenyl-3-methyl-5-hydroxy-6-metoxy-1,4-benzoquinol methylase